MSSENSGWGQTKASNTDSAEHLQSGTFKAKRVVFSGSDDDGNYNEPNVDSSGALKVRGFPLTSFGEISAAEPTPQVQVKFPNGLNSEVVQTLTNKSGATVTASDGLCTIHCPATAEAFSQIRSKDVIRYGPGQGMRARFTAGFTTGVANSTQWAGPGDDDEMLGIGYNGTAFSILHRKFGELEVRDLTITAGESTGAGNITITLDGTAVTIAIEVGDSIADVCAKIVAASADVFNAGRGWEVHTDDSKTVTFISLVAENATGTFSFADTDSTGVTAGTFNQSTTTLEGVAPTETIIAQADWNIDVMDGTGPSGMTLDPTKLNVFDIGFQYLGAGNLFFSIEDTETGMLTPVHMMKHAGASTAATFRQPTFHINMIVKTESGYSGGALDMTTASLAGYLEGKEAGFGLRHESTATVATNGTTEVVNLVVHNEESFNSTRNKIEAYPDFLTIINDATKSIRVDIYKNPTHIDSGVTLSAVNGTSIMTAGTGSGTRQGGNLLLTVAVSASDSKDLHIKDLGIKIRPTETLAFVVTKNSGGNNGDVTVGLSWLERI
jgi:hypothetical protein